jgi:type VI secretion system protein VasI
MSRLRLFLSVIGLVACDVCVARADLANDVAQCAIIKGDLDRLTCFDSLAKASGLAKPQILPVDVTGTGNWIVTKDRNPIDDSVRVVLRLEASTGKGRFGETISFIGRCQSKETEAYIVWNSYLGDDGSSVYDDWKYVTIRIGEQKAVQQKWDVSTDHKATFAPRWAGDLLKQMASANQFIAQTTPYGESPVTAIFDTTGLRAALAPLADACGWKVQ